jgi:acyl-coenzyme A thioesterase PaaI-like protein
MIIARLAVVPSRFAAHHAPADTVPALSDQGQAMDELVFDRSNHFLASCGFGARHDGSSVVGTMTTVPELCFQGTDVVRPSVLVTLVDVTAGQMAVAATAPKLSMTVDFHYQAWARPPHGVIVTRPYVRKAGATTVVTETYLHAAGTDDWQPAGPAFAVVIGTFLSSLRPGDVLPPGSDRVGEILRSAPTLTIPLPERLGIVVVEPGVVQIARRQDVLNPAGTIQGGAFCVACEVAAETAAAAAAGAPQAVVDIDIRYLSATRVGPGRSSTEVLRVGTADGTVATITRVEMRDPGNGDRITGLALCSSVPPASLG